MKGYNEVNIKHDVFHGECNYTIKQNSGHKAESATQPGWDIAIKGSNGKIASVLQAKATESVSYVQDALEKYPSIDVVGNT